MSSFNVGMNEECLSGHYWHGSSQCSRCDARLRCACGCYVREDNLDQHIETCRAVYPVACPACEGLGDVATDFGINAPGRPAIRPCPECNGTGTATSITSPKEQIK